jgi:alpha-N-arabinofuranosidase
VTIQAEVRIDPDRALGTINPNIYGQLVEHVGRSIYGGLYEPGSRLADKAGYRTDVVAAIKELKPSIIRWPGGNFASGYHWRDGIGPSSKRPVRHDLAWGNRETNAFGTEEFLELARRVGAKPYLNINCSTGTFDEAQGWLDYCNASLEGVPDVELRRAGPHPDTHGVDVWGVGNENWGWFQHGHTSAASYGETAREWSKLLRWADPAIQIIGVGGEPDWSWTVLSTAGRFLDMLSLHVYWKGTPEDRYHGIVTGPAVSEELIVSTYGMCLAARQVLGFQHKITLALDEWGVWYRTHPFASANPNHVMRLGLSHNAGVDSRFEESYDLTDALAVASWLHVLWRHPEKVTLAAQATLVNALGPIKTTPDGLVKETTFYPMMLARQWAGPIALDLLVRCEDSVPAPQHPDRSLQSLDAGATFDPETGRVHVSMVNRNRSDSLNVRISGVAVKNAKALQLYNDDPGARNSADKPEKVVPAGVEIDWSKEFELPPHSHLTVVGDTR